MRVTLTKRTMAPFEEQVEKTKKVRKVNRDNTERERERRDKYTERIGVLKKKKRLAPPSSVMAMSHQLWMSGRPHGPHRC